MLTSIRIDLVTFFFLFVKANVTIFSEINKSIPKKDPECTV